MASVNRVNLVGNCGRNPESHRFSSGQVVGRFSIATLSRRKVRHTNETVEDMQLDRVTSYDRLAEIAGDYLCKGQLVYVEGRLKCGKYVDQAGVERLSVNIVASELQSLGPRDEPLHTVGEVLARTRWTSQGADRAARPAVAPLPATPALDLGDPDSHIPF